MSIRVRHGGSCFLLLICFLMSCGSLVVRVTCLSFCSCRYLLISSWIWSTGFLSLLP